MVRRHPILLVRDGLEVCAGLYVLIWLRHHAPDVGAIPGVLTLLMVALLARTAWKVGRWNVDRFIVTSARVLLVTGMLNRQVSMLPLRKLTDMSYRRSSLGQLLGYGEFVMESAGESQALRRVRFLPRPDMLYLALSELLFDRDGVLAVEEY